MEPESNAYGIPLGSLKERSDRFEEGVEVVVSLLENEYTTFSGQYYELADARCEPKPVQRPGPRLWFGGRHPNALRRAVAEGDGWMGAGSSTVAEFVQQSAAVREALAAAGRARTDFRIASNAATFGLTEVRRGIIPAGGSLARLARQIPYTAAMRIILGGEPVSAEDAYRYGLVTELVEPDQVRARAREVAQQVARDGPIALAKAKEAVVRSSGLPLDEAYRIENECARVVMATEDAREGPRAFMEKREPRFIGR